MDQNSAEDNEQNVSSGGTTRRQFLIRSTLAGIGITLAPMISAAPAAAAETEPEARVAEEQETELIINGKLRKLKIDTRVTLLDALRENLMLTGTKKGCDHGQCGACTVLVNGRRIYACLTLAAMCHQAEVTTIEGLAVNGKLHPMQEAFIEHDAFQCGYCTPGQICSAVGLMNEGHAKTDADIKELMSGNICRCGAYSNIADAIRAVQHA